ncbi:MAG TPA: DinB family protein [Acidimicrobiales bacterium]|nr:DinB family protein [Acidimicrobiales bacterium]
MHDIPAPTRVGPPHSGAERDQLDAWLDFHRATILMKCAGLDVEQLRARPVPSSDLSLLGLLRHLTFVEQIWFQIVFSGQDATMYYKRDDDNDADFHDLDSASLEDVVDLFERSCQTSRDLAHGHDLSEMALAVRRGREVDLRWIYIHMIEEYARHNGHADLLRELTDGATGY